ncbi:hypothetical protein [Bacillus cereus]
MNKVNEMYEALKISFANVVKAVGMMKLYKLGCFCPNPRKGGK